MVKIKKDGLLSKEDFIPKACRTRLFLMPLADLDKIRCFDV